MFRNPGGQQTVYICIHPVIILLSRLEFKEISGHPTGQGVVPGVAPPAPADTPPICRHRKEKYPMFCMLCVKHQELPPMPCEASSLSVTANCRVAWTANKRRLHGSLRTFASSLNLPAPRRTWTSLGPCPRLVGHWLRVRTWLAEVKATDGNRAVCTQAGRLRGLVVRADVESLYRSCRTR